MSRVNDSKRGVWRRGSGLVVLAALALFLPVAALRADTKAAPVWSANVHVIEARLAPSVFSRPGFELSLPQLRIYDARSALVLDTTGFSAVGFPMKLKTTLLGRAWPVKGPSQADELARFTAHDGSPLPPLPPADFQVVEWWADWCGPCHSQARQLAEVLSQLPGVRVNLIHVEASLEGMGERKPVRIDDSKLDPKLRQKLLDPKVSSDEKARIIKSLDASQVQSAPPPPHR